MIRSLNHLARCTILAVVALSIAGCSAKKAPPQIRQAPPPLVSSTPSRYGHLVEYVTASGRIRALDRATVGARITGRVQRVAVREGDRVTAGEPLVWLDDRDLQAQVAQAQANLDAAQARVAQIQTGVSVTDTQVNVDVGHAQQGILQANAQVLREQAEYDDALVDLKRKQSLFKQDAIPQTQLDAARLRFRQAKQQLRNNRSMLAAARESLRLARANTGNAKMQRDQLRAARAAREEAAAALQVARVNLGYAVLAAPISGVVTNRSVDPGDAVSAQQSKALLTIVDPESLELVVPVTEQQAPYLTMGEAVEIRTDVGGGRPAQGQVYKVIPSADPMSHTTLVRIKVHDPGGRLVDGMYASARLAIHDHRGVVVPLSAVQTREEESYVMVVHGETVHKQDVQVAFQDGNTAVLRSGLSAGVPVVSTGAEGLKDGETVRLAAAR